MKDAPAPRRWFTGLTWNGIGLIVLACVLNGIRRTIRDTGPEATGDVSGWVAWLAQQAHATAYGLIIALPVAFAVVVAYNVAPPPPARRYTILALVMVASAMASIALALFVDFALTCRAPDECVELGWTAELIPAWAHYGALCTLFAVVFVYVRIAEESTARSRQAEIDRARFVQRMDEARLRMLQAQIEPHFLFNTLANVRRLYQTTPADGDAMLGHLMRYLEVALPQMRAAESTLEREAALTRSYLEIQRLRMGHRLEFRIDVPDAVRATPLPPMMLVTLAENAIKHGLAPLPEGGTVDIRASAHGRELQIRVADSGQGFTQSSGGGTGLANIRTRLAGVYGAAGRLSLALNTPRGIVATLMVPLPPGDA